MAASRAMIALALGAAAIASLYLFPRVDGAVPLPRPVRHAAPAQLWSDYSPAKGLAASHGIRVWPKSATARATLTPSPADEVLLDGMILAEHFDALLERARREPAFAQSLAGALNQCAHEDGAFRWLQINLRVRNAEGRARSLEKYQATFDKCEGLDAEQLMLRIDLAERAARAGVLSAQLAYPGYVAQAVRDGTALLRPRASRRYLENAEAFILAAARSGDPEGLYAAYQLYDLGILVPQDLVRAYRFAVRFERTATGSADFGGLERLTRRMTPEQLRRARSISGDPASPRP